jgi:hypothetical protein
MTKEDQQIQLIFNRLKRDRAMSDGWVIPQKQDNTTHVKICNLRKTMIKGKHYIKLTSYSGGLLCYAYSKKMWSYIQESFEPYVSDELQKAIEDIYFDVCDEFKNDNEMGRVMFNNGFACGFKNYVTLQENLKEICMPIPKDKYEKLYNGLYDFANWVYECQLNGVDPKTVKSSEAD